MDSATFMSRENARAVAGDIAAVEVAAGLPVARWGGNCHSVSLAVLRSGLFGPGRIARGQGDGVRSQHSWIVLGDDCYDPAGTVVDPTIWAYRTPDRPGVMVIRNLIRHFPHGFGDISDAEPLPDREGTLVELPGFSQLSRAAREFLESCGYPFDYRQWCYLASGPVQGWPAAEIITVLAETPRLAAAPPIDYVGMLTDKNPRNLYR